MAQIPAAIWMEPDGTFGVICFRSVAEYAFDLLKTAAMPGSAVKCFDLTHTFQPWIEKHYKFSTGLKFIDF